MQDSSRGQASQPMALERVIAPLRDFLHAETAGGIALLAATLVALVWANSPLASSYVDTWQTELRVGLGDVGVAKPIQLCINDGLIAIFFLVVGLEIKREVLIGELASRYHHRRVPRFARRAWVALGNVRLDPRTPRSAARPLRLRLRDEASGERSNNFRALSINATNRLLGRVRLATAEPRIRSLAFRFTAKIRDVPTIARLDGRVVARGA